ncbi:MAG: hypothetical protein ABIT09_07775 [Croceibacterium sp.]
MSINDVTKKRGRPVTTGKGIPVTVRLQSADLAALDLWIAHNARGESRPEGLRQILRLVVLRLPANKESGADTQTKEDEWAAVNHLYIGRQ